MKVTAVIAEYNPFHNGHLYQFQQIRDGLGADYIIVVMSGDFVQRGIPAVIDKYDRCSMALKNGADVIFELPVYFALGSAEYFAMGAVSLIDKLGVVDHLHFGSECGDIQTLTDCAASLVRGSSAYKTALDRALREGKSFPSARASAMKSDKLPTDTLSSPNDILGTEYIKALMLQKSSITPATIRRTDNGYHSLTLGGQENDALASADALREVLNTVGPGQPDQLSKLKRFVPDQVYDDLYDLCTKAGCRHPFVSVDDFSLLLQYKLLSEFHNSLDHLSRYYDVTHQLANTFYKNLPASSTVSDFTLACKSKNLTYTRISRCLMHILLDMRQDTIRNLQEAGYCQYARLLGFSGHGKKLLKHIKENSSIPIVTRLPKALKALDGVALDSLKADIHASTIYQSVKAVPFPNELIHEVIRAGT